MKLFVGFCIVILSSAFFAAQRTSACNNNCPRGNFTVYCSDCEDVSCTGDDASKSQQSFTNYVYGQLDGITGCNTQDPNILNCSGACPTCTDIHFETYCNGHDVSGEAVVCCGPI